MATEMTCDVLTGLFIADNVSSVLVYPSAKVGSCTLSIRAIDLVSPARRRLDGLKSAHLLTWPTIAFAARSRFWRPR